MSRMALVRLGALGDVVHALPVVAQLRRREPGARIVWIVERGASMLLEGNPWLDDVILIDTKSWRRELRRPSSVPRAVGEIRRLRKRLREERLERAYDLQGLLKSGLVTWLTGAPRRIGFPREHRREPLSGLFLSESVRIPGNRRHVVELYLSVIQGDPDDLRPGDFTLPVPPAERQPMEAFLRSVRERHGSPVLLNLGAGWETKRWPAERFGALAALLRRGGFGPVLLWGPGEQELVRQAMVASEGAAIPAPPTTVRQIVALAREADLFVGCDTGPLHMAWATGTPVVGLYGPTDPGRNGPFRCRARVLWKRRRCSPCHARSCPEGWGCTEEIPLEPVAHACREFLTSERQGPPVVEVVEL